MSLSRTLVRARSSVLRAPVLTRPFSDQPPKNPAALSSSAQQLILDTLRQTSTSKPAGSTIGFAKQLASGTVPYEERAKEAREARRLESQIPRVWEAGDVYAPRDMGPSEMRKWASTARRMRQGTANAGRRDVFDLLGINPLNEYKNFSILAEFTTTMGRIKHSRETGLRKKNQRKIAKAIRRAIGIGLIPSVHHHPELLIRDPSYRI